MNKKILLTLGAVSMTVTPLAAVISCNNDSGDKNEMESTTLSKLFDSLVKKSSTAYTEGIAGNNKLNPVVAEVAATFLGADVNKDIVKPGTKLAELTVTEKNEMVLQALSGSTPQIKLLAATSKNPDKTQVTATPKATKPIPIVLDEYDLPLNTNISTTLGIQDLKIEQSKIRSNVNIATKVSQVGKFGGKVGDDVTAEFKNLPEYKTTGAANTNILKSALSEGISIKVIIEEQFNAQTGQVKLLVLLSRGKWLGMNKRASVTLTFTPNQKTQYAGELIKFKNWTSTATAAESNVDSLSKSTTDVRSIFNIISGYVPPSLSPGISIKSVVVQTAYNPKNRTMVFEVELQGGIGPSAKTDITVTFAPPPVLAPYAGELAKFKGWTSVATAISSVDKLLATPTNVLGIFNTLSGYVPPSLSPGISIKSVVVQTAYNPKTRTIIFEIELQGGTGSPATKDITVKFAQIPTALPAYAGELAKIEDWTSTATASASNVTTLTVGSTNVKATFKAIPGYKLKSSFSKGISIKSVVVKAALTANKVVFEVELQGGSGPSSKKTINVTFTPSPYTGELKKLQKNWTSTATAAASGVATLQVNAVVPPTTFTAILGYKLTSAFSHGISIKSVVVQTVYNTTTKKIVFEVELQGGTGTTTKKTITVTFK